MRRGVKCLAAFACSICFAIPCLAQANPWNGSWKIDPSTVKFEGPTFSVATDNDGYVITRDGKAEPKTVCDSKPHKSPTDGAMVTCNKMGQGYALEVRKNGKLANKIRVSISGDGKTMIRKNEVFPDDGTSPFTITNEARRISAGSGLNGEWKGSSFSESQDKGILSIRVSGGTIAFKETDNDKPIECKLDGTPTKLMDGTMSVKPQGDHTLKVIYTGKDGKVRRDNTFVLSADGKTLTETDVTPSPSASTMSMKFHKM